MKRTQSFKTYVTLPNDGVYTVEATVDRANYNPQFMSVELIDLEVAGKDNRNHANNTFFRTIHAIEYLQPVTLKNGPNLSRLTGIPTSVEYLEVEYMGHTKLTAISALPRLRLRINEQVEVEPIMINLEFADALTREYSVLVNGHKFEAKRIRGAMKLDKNEPVNVDVDFGGYDYQHQVGLIFTCIRQS